MVYLQYVVASKKERNLADRAIGGRVAQPVEYNAIIVKALNSNPVCNAAFPFSSCLSIVGNLELVCLCPYTVEKYTCTKTALSIPQTILLLTLQYLLEAILQISLLNGL